MADIYSTGLLALANGTISWPNSSIKALIVDSGYTLDIDDEFVADVSGDEVTNSTGTGYARKTLTGKTVSLVSGKAVFDCDDLVYTAVTTGQVWDALIVYAEGTSDANSRLLAYIRLDALTTNGSNATIRFSASGVFTIEPA